MMLSCSRVYCSMRECLRSPSEEKRAVLLLFMKFLVLTERLDQFSMMLPRPQTDSFFSSLSWLVLVSHRSVSGTTSFGFFGSLSFFGGLSISRQQAPINPSQYLIQTPRTITGALFGKLSALSKKLPLRSPRCHAASCPCSGHFSFTSQLGGRIMGVERAAGMIIIQLQMSEDKDANIYVVEQVEISSDSDTEQLLEDVHDLDDLQNSLEDIEQLEGLMRSTLRKTQLQSSNESQVQNYQPKHLRRLEVVDDYIRNFLTRHGMAKTLNSFQKEWYECVKGKEEVPDAEIENEVLKDQIEQLRDQLQKAVVLSEKAKATYDKLLKERDFHKMHHQRVQRDKKKLNENIERLFSLQREYEKKYEELAEKYNFTMKEKMLIKIERDKLKMETTVKKEALPSVDPKPAPDGKKTKFTPFPEDEPAPARPGEPFNYKQTVLGKTQKGHTMAVCTVVFHPKKPIIGTGSDDMFWKIWTVNQSELIMSGEGHRDWVSSMKFHPRGHHILTGSGDSTVKVWDFVHSTCTFTFKDHRQPVWSIDLNRTGDYVATGSLDASCRLLDINVGKCRSVFRGHVDSVSSVHFQPTSNLLASASADKTLSIWDTRMALCIQTFYGHQGAVTGCKFNVKGDRLASCDVTGIVKTWDLKAGKEAHSFSTDKRAANCISIDRSGNIIAVGTDDALIMLFNDASGEKEVTLRGHEEKTKVQAVEFDMNSKMIVSGGSDCSYRIWQ